MNFSDVTPLQPVDLTVDLRQGLLVGRAKVPAAGLVGHVLQRPFVDFHEGRPQGNSAGEGTHGGKRRQAVAAGPDAIYLDVLRGGQLGGLVRLDRPGVVDSIGQQDRDLGLGLAAAEPFDGQRQAIAQRRAVFVAAGDDLQVVDDR